jgi:hypothetical protein
MAGPAASSNEECLVSAHPALMVRDGDWWDIEHLAGVCAAAAVNTAVGRWLDRDPLRRGLNLQHHFRRLVTTTLLYGTVRVIEEHGRVLGAALSYYCRRGEPAPKHPATGHDGASCPNAEPTMSDRLDLLYSAFLQSHPPEQHDCLMLTAVAPSRLGEGVTSALIKDHRQRSAGVASYTLAMDSLSSKLYRQHGFAQLEPATLLPDGPQVWPMVRFPSRPGSAG